MDAASAVSDEVLGLTQEAAEAEAGAAVLQETAALEKSRAEQLRTGVRVSAQAHRVLSIRRYDSSVLHCDC